MEGNKFHLPEHTPDDNVWQKINNELEFDAWIVAEKHKLPNHQPAADTWEKIEKELPKPKRPFSAIYRLPIRWAAAAVLLVAIGVGGWLLTAEDNVQITYSTEIVTEKQQSVSPMPLNELDKRCEEIALLCDKKEVKELREEIESLSEESEELQEQLKVFGDDPSLLDAQRKIETKKAELLEQILTYIDHENHS